ncbi:MAG: FGGY family carbohydrate kinase [Parabacteroides sp.]|nr:FGGY family carbohydrate kinase [Parabacteroides sp.]MDK2978023.1 gluconokinase [Bacteroidales bacterium]
MNNNKILAIDVGTTSLKMGIFSESLHRDGFYEHTYPVNIFEDEKAEIDPEVWWTSIVKGCRLFGEKLKEVRLVSFSVTSPGLVAMDRQGRALTKAILFLDQRSHKQAAYIIKTLGRDALLEKGGNLPVSGGSSLSSMLWIRDNLPEVYTQTYKFGHTNTYLIYKLTKQWAIDPSTTSITGLYNTKKNDLTWNTEFLEKLSLPEEKLPDLYQSFQEVGEITDDVARLLGLPPSCKVLCGGNDAVLSAFSAGVNTPGDILHISGTCDIMMVCLDKPVGSSTYNIRSHILPDRWLTLFVLNTGGKSLEWFHSVFCSEMSADTFYLEYIPEVIEKKINGRCPLYKPFLQGSRYSRQLLKAGFSGIGVTTTRDDFLIAILKGNNLYLASHLAEITKVVQCTDRIKITGRAAKIPNMEKAMRKWIGEYHYTYIEQSSLHGAAKLGEIYYKQLKT